MKKNVFSFLLMGILMTFATPSTQAQGFLKKLKNSVTSTLSPNEKKDSVENDSVVKPLKWDKIPVYQDEWLAKGLVYHSTDDIIAAADAGNLPMQMMITTHPQRWTDKKVDWLIELVSQSAKNVVKKIMVRKG